MWGEFARENFPRLSWTRSVRPPLFRSNAAASVCPGAGFNCRVSGLKLGEATRWLHGCRVEIVVAANVTNLTEQDLETKVAMDPSTIGPLVEHAA